MSARLSGDNDSTNAEKATAAVKKSPAKKAATTTANKPRAKRAPTTANKPPAERGTRLPWVPVFTDSVQQPPGPGQPGQQAKGDDLDLNIGWDRFEKLVLAVSRNLLGIGDIQLRRYGTPGQAQHGIDIAGREPDGRYSVVQCKDYTAFTKAKLKAAVEKFAGERTNLPFAPYRFVIATSFRGDPTQFHDELTNQQAKYPDLELTLWGSEIINEALRTRADIVARFWTKETAENFCTVPIPGTPTPAPNRARQADQVLVGPLEMDDVALRLRRAKSETIDPSAAAKIFDSVASTLEEGRFRAYAFSVRDDQIDALVRAGSVGDAAALAGRLAAVSLYQRDDDSAHRLRRRLDELAGDDIVSTMTGKSRKGPPDVKRHAELIRAAVDAARDPFGDTDHLIDVLNNPPNGIPVPEYQPLIVLVLAESMLVDKPDKLSGMDELVSKAHDQVTLNPIAGVPNDVTVRLRLIRSEYNGDERERLTREANTHSITKRHSSLVKAREARRHALAARQTSAESYWRDAISDGIHDTLADDAADWLFAIRRLKHAYGPWTFGADEEYRRAQALQLTPGDQILRRFLAPRERALTEIVGSRANSAIVATRQWLIDSIVTGHWADEAHAFELLGDLYSENSETDRAAICYQKSGGTDKLTELIKSIGDHRISVGALSEAPWWELRARVQILGNQADLLDDETAATRLSELTQLALRGRSGELVEDPQRALTIEATKSACALAARGSAAQAQGILDLLAPDVARESNHYRRSDPAHAKACVAIATTHPDLAFSSLERLFDLADHDTYDALVALYGADVLSLLGSKQYNERAGVPNGVSPLTDAQRAHLQDRVRRLVAAGRYLSSDILQQLEPDSPDLHASAVIARNRILQRPKPSPNSSSSGTGLGSDAALVRGLDRDDQRKCLEKLLAVAHDAEETAEIRREALGGASLLVGNQPDEIRATVFDSCRSFTSGEKDGSAFDEMTGVPHPLSTFKVNLGPSSLRSAGLSLALAAADNNDQYAWILDEAFVLFRSTEDNDVSKAAHIVNRLPRAITDGFPSYVISGISGSSNVNVRQLAAVLTIRSADDNQGLALQLAQDPDANVRRTLAEALSVAEPSEVINRIREVVQNDIRYSVRRRLIS